MNREYHRWYSPSLGQDMALLVFGHAGARVLAFPTEQGSFQEWENGGMVDALGEYLTNGWLQLYCVTSVDTESWHAVEKHPGARVWRHMEYQNYLLYELLPFSQQKNSDPFLITTGAGFGAYHAVNFALRYPHLVDRTIGMSGCYDISPWISGYSNEHVYNHNPCWYIPNEHEQARLDALQRIDIILAVGREDTVVGDSECLSYLLWEKGIGNALRVWNGLSHDWSAWGSMIQFYIEGHD